MRSEEFFDNQQARIGEAQYSALVGNQVSQDMMNQEENKGLVKEQLDLEPEKLRIRRFLMGYIKKEVNGRLVWQEPDDKTQLLFSEQGVNEIMGILEMYINKNNLLSYYDEQTILNKMEDFSTSLVDKIFMKYELFFRQPTLEQCKDELKARINKRVDIIKFSHELLNKKFDKDFVEKKIMLEMEPIVEDELEKIRNKLMKDKLKDFDMIMRSLQDAVHATYNRAFKGMERKSLRQHWHITESNTPNISSEEVKGWFGKKR